MKYFSVREISRILLHLDKGNSFGIGETWQVSIDRAQIIADGITSWSPEPRDERNVSIPKKGNPSGPEVVHFSCAKNLWTACQWRARIRVWESAEKRSMPDLIHLLEVLVDCTWD